MSEREWVDVGVDSEVSDDRDGDLSICVAGDHDEYITFDMEMMYEYICKLHPELRRHVGSLTALGSGAYVGRSLENNTIVISLRDGAHPVYITRLAFQKLLSFALTAGWLNDLSNNVAGAGGKADNSKVAAPNVAQQISTGSATVGGTTTQKSGDTDSRTWSTTIGDQLQPKVPVHNDGDDDPWSRFG